MTRQVTWIDADNQTRTGEVWSPGPTSTSVWVIPDEPREGEAHAVCVGTNGKQTRAQMNLSTVEHQAKVIEALVNRRPVPGVKVRITDPSGSYGPYNAEVPQYGAPRGGQLTAKFPTIDYYAAEEPAEETTPAAQDTDTTAAATDVPDTTESTGKCLRCGRVLRSAKAVAAGYGPVCAAKIRNAAKVSTEKSTQVAKAVELVEVGGIVPVRGRRVFRATSTDGTRSYLVAATGQCTCPAGLRGRHGCYHALAAQLVSATPAPAARVAIAA